MLPDTPSIKFVAPMGSTLVTTLVACPKMHIASSRVMQCWISCAFSSAGLAARK